MATRERTARAAAGANLMRVNFAMARLGRHDLVVRGAAMFVIMTAAVLLKFVPPESVSWLPIRTSCGAASGLPCLFCGTTRALHHLLNGELRQALYFNWLALPVAAAFGALAFQLAAELVARRRLLLPLRRVRLTPQSLAAGLAVIFALWVVQVSLAVRFHKHELLNPEGPLYALFLK
jgi:hypothetical protein